MHRNSLDIQIKDSKERIYIKQNNSISDQTNSPEKFIKILRTTQTHKSPSRYVEDNPQIYQSVNIKEGDKNVKASNISSPYRNSSSKLRRPRRDIKDEHYDKRIELLQNLYFRQRNLIIAMVMLQNQQDQQQNAKQRKYIFFQEIKSLLKNIYQLSKLLPFGMLQRIEIFLLISVCDYKMNRTEKAFATVSQCENYLQYLSQIQAEERNHRVYLSPLIQQQKSSSNENSPEYFNKLDRDQNFSKNKLEEKQVSSMNYLSIMTTKHHSQNEEQINFLHNDNTNLNKSDCVNQEQYESYVRDAVKNLKKQIEQFQQNQFKHELNKEENLYNFSHSSLIVKSYLNSNRVISTIYKDTQKQEFKSSTFEEEKTSYQKHREEDKEKQYQNFIRKQQRPLTIISTKSRIGAIKKFNQLQSKSNLNNSDQDSENHNLSQVSPDKINEVLSVYPVKQVKIKEIGEDYSCKDLDNIHGYQDSSQQDLESVFEKRRLAERLKDTETQLKKYYSIYHQDVLIFLRRAEYLRNEKRFYEAAVLLTYLIENKRCFISHQPFKIFYLLRDIFRQNNIFSPELQNICKKFNRDISFQIGMVFAVQEESGIDTVNSIKLVSDVVSQVLVKKTDQLGIILYNKQEQYMHSFMPFTAVPQIKDSMKGILNGIIKVISQYSLEYLFEQAVQIQQNSQYEDDLDLVFSNIQDQQHQSFNQLQPSSIELVRNSKRHNSTINEVEEKKSNYQEINCIKPIFMNNPCKLLEIKDSFNSTKQTFFQTNRILNIKIKENKGDIQSSQQRSTERLETASSGTESSRKRVIDRRILFHLSIQRALLELFVNTVKSKYVQMQIVEHIQNATNKRDKFNFSVFNSTQFKYIVYVTDELEVNQDDLFDKLVLILDELDIQLLIFSSKKGTCFLEQQCDLTYSSNNKEIIRIFYSNEVLVSYLQFCRDHYSSNVFSTVVQHY